MADREKITALGRLLARVAREHHDATGGAPSDWAEWYADRLRGEIDSWVGFEPPVAQIESWLQDADVGGVVIRSGKEGSFCVGSDLNELQAGYDLAAKVPALDWCSWSMLATRPTCSRRMPAVRSLANWAEV